MIVDTRIYSVYVLHTYIVGVVLEWDRIPGIQGYRDSRNVYMTLYIYFNTSTPG